MKNEKRALVCFAAAAALSMTAIPGFAQIVGYQVAIAPTIRQPVVNQPIVVPGFAQPIFAQPIIVSITPQAVFGFLPTQAPPIVVRSPFHHGQPVVTVPNTVFIPGPVFVPAPHAHFGPPVLQVTPPRTRVIVIIRNGQVVSVTR